MKKVFIIVFLSSLTLMTFASNHGKRVKVRRNPHASLPSSRYYRTPPKELVTLYQEENILHVNVMANLVVVVSFYDETESLLGQEVLTSLEADLEIPTSASTVEVSYNDISLIGILY